MKTITVSDATYRVIADLAILPFRSTGKRQADGSWLVPVDDEVHARLNQERLPGETDDDTVIRLINQYRGRKPS